MADSNPEQTSERDETHKKAREVRERLKKKLKEIDRLLESARRSMGDKDTGSESTNRKG